MPGHAGCARRLTLSERPGGDAGRDLYGLDPGAFTAARNTLARRLRTEGHKAEAALVARLRRPPVTAWALNQVARHQPGVIDAVLDAGAGLRAATEDALGGDASGLRTAQAWERRAVEAAVAAAVAHLVAAGHGAGDVTTQRMTGTVRAALVDATVAAALREGILDDDRDAPGFGLDAFSPAVADSAAKRRSRAGATTGGAGAGGVTEGGDPGTGRAEVPATPDEAEAARSVAAAEAARARGRAAQLRAEADQAENLAQAAREQAVGARAQADRANDDATRLERAAEAAATQAASARAVAERAEDEVRAAADRAGAHPGGE